MAERLDWQNSDDRRDLVHRAVQSLVEGRLVVFPTETVYGLAAHALHPEAVERLLEAKGRSRNVPLTLALASPEESFKYAPAMSDAARRLVERCWPGPVTIVFPEIDDRSEVHRLPESVRALVAPPSGVGLRIVDHPAILETLKLLPGPLVLTSANRSGDDDPLDADAAIASLGQSIDLAIDDGPTRYAGPSTVVRVAGDDLQILREGVVSATRLRRLKSEVITFVCTGNTCRSPMAEAIFKRMLADRLGCDIQELPDRGYTVLSAGLAAMAGASATEGAFEAVREYKADLGDHVSQSLSAELALFSDRLIVMTQDHRNAIRRMWPLAAAKTELLLGDRDLSDPVGEPIERYHECAGQIERQLRTLLDDVLSSSG